MPNRVIRQGILTSSRVNALSLGAELFYRRLMSVVDDYGRHEADLSLLRAAVFPRRLHEVTEVQIKQWLQECTTGDRPLITLYYVATENYLVINNFNQRLRSMKSRCPSPDSPLPAHGQPNGGHVPVSGQAADSQTSPPRAETESESESETNRITPPLPPPCEKGGEQANRPTATSIRSPRKRAGPVDFVELRKQNARKEFTRRMLEDLEDEQRKIHGS
jgi:hypothetical protein